MNIQTSDSIRAGLIAAGLWGMTAVIYFGIPRGFEEQIGGFLILLPGFLIGALVADAIPSTHAAVATCAFWGVSLFTNSLCYFGICFVVVNAYRLAREFLAIRM